MEYLSPYSNRQRWRSREKTARLHYLFLRRRGPPAIATGGAEREDCLLDFCLRGLAERAI